MADSRKGWGQLVPNNIQSGFIVTGDGPPPLLVRILESAVMLAGARQHARILVDGRGVRINMQRLIVVLN